MSQASFDTHLEQLVAVLTLLITDFQDGPVAQLNTWYDKVVDDLYDFEDQAEAIIDARLGLDEESFEDQEDEVEITDEITDEVSEINETDNADDEDDFEEDTDVEEDTSTTVSSLSPKKITININLK